MIKPEDFSETTEFTSKLMPGQMLKSARESQGITLEAISQHLHLTIPTILSIEADHYAKMPAPVYVRGYLRRYANFVRISPEEVLTAYEQNVEIKSKILEETPSYVKKKTITSNHMGIRFITYSIALLLLILIGLWWKDHEDNVKPSANPQQPLKKSETTQSKNQAPKNQAIEHNTPSFHKNTLNINIHPASPPTSSILGQTSQSEQTQESTAARSLQKKAMAPVAQSTIESTENMRSKERLEETDVLKNPKSRPESSGILDLY